MLKELKYGGYSASPNDHDSLEGDLAVAMNLVPEHHTIRPVEPPKVIAKIPWDAYLGPGLDRKIVCIHRTSAYTHYIVAIQYPNYHGNTSFWYLYTWDGTQESPLVRIGDMSYNDIRSVEPVGNTLVVLADDGVHYILWDVKTGAYRYLGQKPPRIDITFGLSSKFVAYPGFNRGGAPLEPVYFQGEWYNSQEKRSIPTYSAPDYYNLMLPKPKMTEPSNSWGRPAVSEDWSGFDFTMEDMAGDEEAINADIKCMTDAALGAVNKLIDKEGTSKGLFVFPFFVRYAYEMYDRSTVMHSYPVLMIPNSRGPIFAMDMGIDSNNKPGFSLHWNSDNGTSRIEGYGRAYAFVSKLCYDAFFPNLDDWKDLIHKVNVYVSAPAYTMDQDGKVFGWQNMDDEGAWDSFYTVGKLEETNLTAADGYNADHWKRWQLSQVFPADTRREVNGQVKKLFSAMFWQSGFNMPSWVLKVPEPNEEKMRQRILDAAIFYKIHSFDIDELTGDHSTSPLSGTIDLKEGELKTLLARDTLDDDYFTRDTIQANTCFAYNSRINLAGVSRIQHKPLDAHIAWAKYKDGENDKWNIAVRVKGQDRENVLTSGLGQNDIPMPMFVYYPDPSAVAALVNRGGVTFDLKLKEHPLLSGAYWLGSLWGSDDVPTVDSFPVDDAEPVKRYNSVFTSQVDNPFFFPKVGVNSISTGEIMAVCAAVRPVSTSQVGYADLYIFADNGVWTAKITKEGFYSDVTLITGDICINPDSITQMETTVLFATARGIMLLSGSQAQCISGAIDDDGQPAPGLSDITDLLAPLLGLSVNIKPFREFLGDEKQCVRTTYDYRGQRIIAYNPSAAFPYAYIYSLESNKWGMMWSNISYAVRAYPDAIAVTQGGMLVNFSETGELSFVDPLSTQLLVTRPLTLDQPDVLKTVTTVLQRGLFRKHQGHVQAVLYGSRDLYNWHMVMSSTDENMRGRRGTPYKWYRVALLLRLPSGESVEGCSIQFETKYTNRLR